MVKKQTGLLSELIIHPGETLLEIINDRNMTQKELASRTGVTEKHISTVVNGEKPISTSFAKKLEYALGIKCSFWVNLQQHYDIELLEFEEINGITEQEIDIAKKLTELVSYFISDIPKNICEKVIKYRNLLGLSNLTLIPNVALSGAYRGSPSVEVDIYVLYAWLKLCELDLLEMNIDNEINIPLLKQKIPQIKELMFKNINTALDEMTDIFNECGIKFKVVKHFAGAPLQGFIKKYDNYYLLCMTIRQKYADIFWFTLFHEIAHIINGNAEQKKGLIDFEFTRDENENKADEFARNALVNEEEYKKFVSRGIFAENEIKAFSEKQNVLPCIIVGRLQKDKLIAYNQFSEYKIRYDWK